MSRCVFCNSDGGEVVWRSELCRVVFAGEPDYPGFMRVVLNAHVKEMTDLAVSDRTEVMRVVFAVEAAIRQVMRPDKTSPGQRAVHGHDRPTRLERAAHPQPELLRPCTCASG